jgi:hypothetical protein
MPQRASVFCNFYIRVDREAFVSERALDVGKQGYEYKKMNFVSVQMRFSFYKFRHGKGTNVQHKKNDEAKMLR